MNPVDVRRRHPAAAGHEPLFTWWRKPFQEQHAFRPGLSGWARSICGRIRFTVLLEAVAEAAVCDECRGIVWALTGAARDYVVDAESAADGRDTDRRLREQATTEAELVAGYGGLPTER